MLETALELDGPAAIRFPKTPPRHAAPGAVGQDLRARRVARGDGSICLLGVGKLLAACEAAAEELAADGVAASVWDVRVVSPPDAEMLADAGDHEVVLTAEDGARFGGAGMFLADALAGQARSAGHRPPPVEVLGAPRRFIAQAKPDAILAELGLDGPGVAAAARRALAASRRQSPGAASEAIGPAAESPAR